MTVGRLSAVNFSKFVGLGRLCLRWRGISRLEVIEMKIYLLWKAEDGTGPQRLLGAYSSHDLALFAESNYMVNNPWSEETFITQVFLDLNHMEIV